MSDHRPRVALRDRHRRPPSVDFSDGGAEDCDAPPSISFGEESRDGKIDDANRPSDRFFGSPSILTSTDDHPLMIPSPARDGAYPDLVPPSCRTRDDDRSEGRSGAMSPSSVEDESLNRSPTIGRADRYGPQRNTSKNNLYFTENFTGVDGARGVEEFCTVENGGENVNIGPPDILERNAQSPPDLTIERKKIRPDAKTKVSHPKRPYKILGRIINVPADEDVQYSYEIDGTGSSRSDLESSSNMPSNTPSPDSSSSSHPDNERSLYRAEVDPYGGRVSLKPKSSTPAASVPPKKRVIPLPMETDTESTVLSDPTLFVSCQNKLGSSSSLDSLSDCSLQSDGVCADQIDLVNKTKQTSSVLKQISALKSTDVDNFSDTETETEGPKNDVNSTPEKIPEYSLSEERQDTRRWLKVTLPSGERRTIDMKVIEPYKRVLSHGGYALSGRRDAIVVFSACYLPDSSRVDYNYVMDNLFLYVLTTLEQLVTEEYILVYLHGSASKRSMPTFHWLKKCYQLIDRRLRKSLKHLYLVHPTFWLKSIMWMTKPFISTKFSRKLSYVNSLEELENLIPVEYAAIPEKVRRYDNRRSLSV